MSRAESANVHRTAVVSSDVELGENVEVGAFTVLEGPISIGADCVIRPGSYLFGPITMGQGNTVHTGAVLGDLPQHLKFKGDRTFLEIGDGNTFREHVTIHRGTTHSMKTTIGDNNLFMVGSHVGHDCVIGNRCILTNGSMVGGHSILEDSVILSGNSAVHQFVRVGRLALLSGISGTTKDIPPFIIHQGIDNTCGINVIGMRRAGHSNAQINAARAAFRVLFREGIPLTSAMAKLEHDLGHVDVVQEMLQFLNGCHKGVNPMRGRNREEAA